GGVFTPESDATTGRWLPSLVFVPLRHHLFGFGEHSGRPSTVAADPLFSCQGDEIGDPRLVQSCQRERQLDVVRLASSFEADRVFIAGEMCHSCLSFV